jgi:hypothetical protein
MTTPMERQLNDQFDAWFSELQKLTEDKLNPEDWTER